MISNASLRWNLSWVILFLIVPAFTKAQGICNPDDSAPNLANCPLDMSFTIPTGECLAVVDWDPPTVIGDDCDTTNAISAVNFFTYHRGQGDGNNGQFILHATDSFTVIGTTNGTPGNGSNRFLVCFYAPCNGMLDFKWRASIGNGDGFMMDRARFSITHAVHGANVDLPLTTGNDSSAEGSVLATLVLAGDRICFEVNSDNTDGVTSLTVRDIIFIATPISVVQTLGPTPGDSLPQGNYAVQYTATDCGGNTAVCDFIVSVLPAIPPGLLLDCPGDVTIQLPSTAMCDTILSAFTPVGITCGPVLGFTEELDPFILGVQTTEEAQAGMGDGVIGTDGYAYVNPAKDSLVLVGINNGTPGNARNDTSVITVCVQPRCAGTFSFDWSASVGFMNDFLRDEAGIIFNGKDSILSQPSSGDYAVGSVTFESDGINPLCFYVRSTNMGSEDTLIITNLVFNPTPLQIIEIDTFDITQPLGPGIYQFIFHVRDCFGNLDSCLFTATILAAPSGSLSCRSLNISLNENCEALITPDMLVTGVCTDAMIVELSLNGIPISNPVDSSYLWQHIIATVIDTLNGNSCWGDLLIEDKLAPFIVCEADTTDCYSFNFDFPLNYDGRDCSQYSVTTIDERIEHFSCDSVFLKAVYRDILLTDESGNTDQCTDTIFVTRIQVSDIILPDIQVDINCENVILVDANGNPHPLLTGIPSVLLSSGVTITIWPLNILLDCNLLIQYEDIDLGEINCVRKIMRSWTVREWFCGTEITRTSLQLITITDRTGPVITRAPYNFSATTGRRDCEARVLLPSIEATDACHGPIRVDIAYPGGILINQNGGYANIPAGLDTIFYRVYDACLNLTELFIIIDVTDATEPVAVCDRNTVVSLNQAGIVWVPAEVFDDGSFDECAVHHFEVRRMDSDFCGGLGEDTWGPEVSFCCEDVGNTVMVGFKVIDFNGNEAICMVNVVVQDKSRPLIICIPDITIDCRFDIDFNRLEVFGKIVTDTLDREKIIIDPRFFHIIGGHPQDGLASDNCPPFVVELVDSSNVDQCGLGFIIRTFQAFDQQGNSSEICRQVITIINQDTFDIDDIVWPLDLDTFGICDPALLIPERLDSLHGVPLFNDDECSLIGTSYHDVVLSPILPGDPCFKILRTWKVIDWCQRDINNEIIIFTHLQIIRVRNLIDPIITRVSSDTIVCSYDVNCQPIPVRFSIEAVDDCTPANLLLYTYKIDFDGDGTIDVIRSAIGGNVAEGTFPIGRHIVKWEVEDRCGNTAKEQFILDLQNCKSPIAYCLNGLSTNLTPMDTNGDGIPDTAMDSVWAADFDAGSYHNCGYYVTLSFSADTTDTFRVYDCDSIGTRLVSLWVTDINGNTSFCRTFIDIQDNSGFCPPNLKNSNVVGLVETEKSDRVQNVTIALTNSGMNEVQTDANGRYSFIQIPNGKYVIVKPSKTDGWLNGVTTADIVKIQRHILGIETLNSAYKMIAADVNRSRNITAKDVSDLRRMILGITNEVPGNTSWRFVHQLYSFADVMTALNQNFPESYEINPLNNNMSLDFYAVKTGDVNESATTKGFNGNIGRNRNVLELQIEDQKLQKDEITEIEIKVANGSGYEGMQFTLQWDVNQLELENVHGNAALKIKDENYSILRSGEGTLSFSWNGHMKDGDWILKLSFSTKQATNLSEAIRVNSLITPAISVLKGEGEEGQVVMSYKGSIVDEFVVLQNEPNPWGYETKIGMLLPQAGEVSISVYDAAGKIYLNEKIQMSKGYNEYVLNQEELGHSGVYYYQVDYLMNTITHKMVITK